MSQDRSTLFTSPLSQADFLFRLAFFALAPFAIVLAAELFPVRGALVDGGLALGVFLMGEAARRWASRGRFIAWLLSQALAFEAYYRARPPRPFAYYFFYPLLFPYWLLHPEARREFLVFRGYTLGSLLVLLISLAWQYFAYWKPELDLRAFLPTVAITLAVETLLVLSLLMPIATTVVWYHSSFRRGRLLVVLLVGLFSTTLALARVARRRDPIVSYATRERVLLRTAAVKALAHQTMLDAVHEAKVTTADLAAQEDGKVEGAPVDRARARLETFYKHDEAYAFDLWAGSDAKPGVLVLYFEARRKKPPIWVAIDDQDHEIHRVADLPKGAFRAMRLAADGSDVVPALWSDDRKALGP